MRGTATDAITLGVEEEFFLVDGQTGALTSNAPAAVDAAQLSMGAAVTRELNRCQIEVASVVCDTTDQLRDDLVRLRRDLGESVRSVGSAIVAAGTHPFSSWEDQRVDSSSERFVRMEERYQAIARQQVICGCHVHVGIADPDLAVDVMNRSRPWLPVLLALSANSPFWRGIDTGYASYRTQVWRRWPTSGMPPTIRDRAHYEEFIAELVAVGAIDDPSYLYWYARPSARYPTVEFRSCDVCVDVDDTVAIAALVRALAWTCGRDAERNTADHPRSVEVLDACVWRAARYGLTDALVDPQNDRIVPAGVAVDALLRHVEDGLRVHGDHEMVTAQVTEILRRGNGATLQRTAHRSAAGDPAAVVTTLAETTIAADVAAPLEPLIAAG